MLKQLWVCGWLRRLQLVTEGPSTSDEMRGDPELQPHWASGSTRSGGHWPPSCRLFRILLWPHLVGRPLAWSSRSTGPSGHVFCSCEASAHCFLMASRCQHGLRETLSLSHPFPPCLGVAAIPTQITLPACWLSWWTSATEG